MERTISPYTRLELQKLTEIETPIMQLGIHFISGFVMNIKANVVPEVTGEKGRAPTNSTEIKAKLQTFE